MKEIEWLGSSKRDLSKLPLEPRQKIGYALYVAQLGDNHNSSKLFKGFGSGVYEIVCNYNKNAYRAVYLVNNKIYVLHIFQKKSKNGIKTPKEELVVIEERLKRLRIKLAEEKIYEKKT